MSSTAKMVIDCQAIILDALKEKEYLPIDLMEYLATQKCLSDASSKSAILELLREAKIEFGPDQKLRLRTNASAASSKSS